MCIFRFGEENELSQFVGLDYDGCVIALSRHKQEEEFFGIELVSISGLAVSNSI